MYLDIAAARSTKSDVTCSRSGTRQDGRVVPTFTSSKRAIPRGDLYEKFQTGSGSYTCGSRELLYSSVKEIDTIDARQYDGRLTQNDQNMLHSCVTNLLDRFHRSVKIQVLRRGWDYSRRCSCEPRTSSMLSNPSTTLSCSNP